MSDSDGLFPAAKLEHVDAVIDQGVEAGAGVNMRFRAFEPDAVMLVPPPLDEWLPQKHLSRFIADVVETQLYLGKFYASYAKTKGQPPDDPRLMVRVLLYGYCVGVRSSRELERVCVDVVAFRWLAAQQAPQFSVDRTVSETASLRAWERVPAGVGTLPRGRNGVIGTGRLGRDKSSRERVPAQGDELRPFEREAEDPRGRSLRALG